MGAAEEAQTKTIVSHLFHNTSKAAAVSIVAAPDDQSTREVLFSYNSYRLSVGYSNGPRKNEDWLDKKDSARKEYRWLLNG